MSEISAAYDLARFVIEFVSVVKRGDVEWQKQKLEEITELRRHKRIHEANLDHELNMLKVKFAEEIKREQEKESRITNDYRDFLDSIDEMKKKMLETFSDMPKPMVFIIHHHAKHLIDDIWKSPDDRSQALSRSRFADFLTAVYDDTSKALVGGNQQFKLPAATLKLIKGPTG